MSLVKWNPWREIEDVFDRNIKRVPSRLSDLGFATSEDWTPKVDISETDKEFIIKAELPEVKREDVKVTVDKGVLTICGERKQEREEEGKTFHRVERYYGSFTRSFTLPENVDESKVDASYKDGMLNLKIEKTEEAKPTSIEVEIK
ncbi:Hsp20/alpha crystallin family protein [Desulfotalea psychrophila]|nr:Hsp20/alpha crystallin family protein [Desulfotalea psychrophila]